MKTLIPLADKVVIKEPEQPANKAGIDLARASKERPTIGVVLAVGKSVEEVKVGDEVAFTRFGPNEVVVEDITYWVLEEKQILTKIKEK